MDPFLNPVFLLRVAKIYFLDLDRIFKQNKKQIEKYQNKSLRKVVKYAYNVPLYHDKYKKAGIKPGDIKGIKDINKLPFITKDDLRNYYSNGIIPKNFNKKNAFLMSTSGSTGKPVFVYTDKLSSIKRLTANIRELKVYGGSWNKSKICLIIDLEQGSVENTVFSESALPIIKRFFTMNNIRYIHIGQKPDIIITELDKFQPEFIGSDPNMLRDLAFLKNQGFGKNIQPKAIISSGAMLDNYTRKYIEKAFCTKVYDVYGSTEAGSLAFECTKGNYHVISDFAYLEFLDKDNTPVEYGKSGRLVVTRLYGQGTPIIRYTGNEDYLIPLKEDCSCGINTQIIKQIEGRQTDMIILPNGKTYSPLNVTGIPAKIMDKYNTYKIKQFQIIQHKKDKIEVLIIIDEELRSIGPSVKTILDEIKKSFEEKIGPGVDIVVNEVDEIQKDARSDYVKVMISKVKK